MSLPILISVPHGGLAVPPEVESNNLLNEQEIFRDGDEGAADIYSIENEVLQFVTTDIARAFVDLNRAEDDRRVDGVVKTHTCWDVPIYRRPLPEDTVSTLLERYYRPYHDRLTGPKEGVILGIDCHTMAAVGPPIGPMAGEQRPPICLSNAGSTCPESWLRSLADCLEAEFQLPVSLNFPFKGGYIIRAHSQNLPWVQLELSRAAFMAPESKRQCLLGALKQWCRLQNRQ